MGIFVRNILRLALDKPRLRSLVPIRQVSKCRPRTLLELAVEEARSVYRDARSWRCKDDVFVCDVRSGVEVMLSKRSLSNGTAYTVVSFCGTERWTDWTCNFMLFLADAVDKPCTTIVTSGRAHAGFLARWRSIRHKLLAALTRVCTPSSRVVVTGHSLGGAVAALAAVDIAMSMPHATVSLATFGAPMFADARYNGRTPPKNLKRVVRCVHVGDFVQYLPPLPQYTHPSFGDVVVVGERRRGLTRATTVDRGMGVVNDHPLVQGCVRLWQDGLGIQSHDVMCYWQAIVERDMRYDRSSCEHKERT